MLDKSRFVNLLTARIMSQEEANSIYDYLATGVVRFNERLPGLYALCEQIIVRIIYTEYDVTKDGKKGIGRMDAFIPRLIAEFPALGSTELLTYARTASQDAAIGAIVSTFGSFLVDEVVKNNARIPSEDELWKNTVLRINEGAAEIETAVDDELPYGTVTMALGAGTTKLIEQEAQRTGVVLFKDNNGPLFNRILVFHATFGWTVASTAISIITRG